MATRSTCCSFRKIRTSGFEHASAALDLADRLQTPVFVMTDLDIGMNQRLCAPFEWDDSRTYDRGKVMTREELDAGRDFGRYKDVDGDGIPYRTYPGTHPDRGGYFTRGTTKNPYAVYSEAGPDYVYNVQRLLRKFETAKTLVPQPVISTAKHRTPIGAIFYGSTSPAMAEAVAALEKEGIAIDTMRLRAFPFPDSVTDFIDAHEQVFVIEQNRDAQLRTMLLTELNADAAKADAVAALRRHAHHRPLHHPGDRRPGAPARGGTLREGQGGMTYIAKPRLHHPTLPQNRVGFTRRDYEGKISTLCAGCGHDSISAAIIEACWDMDIEPHRVAKLSGIGCSSKTPDYFLGKLARLQHRPRSYALRPDRRQSRESHAALSRRLGRW